MVLKRDGRCVDVHCSLLRRWRKQTPGGCVGVSVWACAPQWRSVVVLIGEALSRETSPGRTG